MNRKQRRIAQSQNKHIATIRLGNASYTLEEADALAIKEYRHGNLQSAIDIYRHIIACDPENAIAYNNRGTILKDINRDEEALASLDKAIALKADYAEAYNNRGITLQKMRRLEESLASLDRAIALRPDNAIPYNNKSVTLQRMKRYAEALAMCDQAIALKPDYAEAYSNRGINLNELRRYEEALASYDKAIALNPGDARAYNNKNAVLLALKRYDEALATCDKAIALAPDYAEAYHNRGLTLADKGDIQEAQRMFVKALGLKPTYPRAWFSLVNIRKYRDADHADIKALKALLPNQALDEIDYLHFSLGKIYNDCGLYDEAFACYQKGNRILNAEAFYDPLKTEEQADAIISIFGKEFLTQRFGFASENRQPLFIVGMPRSGTTLMAGILSNHPAVATAGELPDITEMAMRLPYPQAAAHISPTAATSMIKHYETRLRRDAAPDAAYIIDKHPINFLHLGFIAMLFPNAHVIHCTRHPLDTGLSNYFQRFSMNYNYCFDLGNIGHFYRQYEKLMAHWRKALPLKMIEISYENMVMDTEAMARRALEFLGLGWDERCLSPHTNPMPVETASKWQVRQPVYKQALERWRHYEKHLAPLKSALHLAELQ